MIHPSPYAGGQQVRVPVARVLRSIPNVITVSRLVAVPVMLAAAWTGHRGLFLSLVGYALMSDVVDGRLARAFDAAGPAGATLDSVADCALYLTLPLVVCLVFPWARHEIGTVIGVVYIGYILPVTYGVIKYRRLTCYHTTAARSAAVLLALGFVAVVVTHVVWPLAFGAGVLLVSAAEEIAITRLLPAWHADVRSVRDAARLIRPGVQGST